MQEKYWYNYEGEFIVENLVLTGGQSVQEGSYVEKTITWQPWEPVGVAVAPEGASVPWKTLPWYTIGQPDGCTLKIDGNTYTDGYRTDPIPFRPATSASLRSMWLACFWNLKTVWMVGWEDYYWSHGSHSLVDKASATMISIAEDCPDVEFRFLNATGNWDIPPILLNHPQFSQWSWTKMLTL